MQLSWRSLNFLGASVGIILLAIALYFQFVQNLEPCPLCIMQRLVFLLLTLVLLVGGIHNPQARGQQGYALGTLIIALSGVALAGWQLYLQYFPHNINTGCGPGFNYMVMNLPLSTSLKMIFYGTAECAEISWTFLGLSLAYPDDPHLRSLKGPVIQQVQSTNARAL